MGDVYFGQFMGMFTNRGDRKIRLYEKRPETRFLPGQFLVKFQISPRNRVS
jgi:hypothetical protein